MVNIEKSKSFLRNEFKNKRKEFIFKNDTQCHNIDFLHAFIGLIDDQKITSNNTIALYYPLLGEPSTLFIIEWLNTNGYITALPCIIESSYNLVFSSYAQGDRLTKGVLGFYQPEKITPIYPNIIIAPMLCFDNHGNRVGFGKGFYDKTVFSLRKKKSVLYIGIAHCWQEANSIPADKHDIPLDILITNKGYRQFNHYSV